MSGGGRVGIALAGGAALTVLARAAMYYRHTDSLALALVLMMTAALVVGMTELLGRAARAEELTRELATLPAPATTSAVDAASAPLRALLRARIAHAPSSVTSAPLAPYLVGLLVMLGLLGTFLGLFETLRGAREALTTSGDVDALRASLAMPMQGLTRSFGTSAAGVSASAMLGLAVTFARRTEARFAQALGLYAAGALAPLTTQERQLVALEKIASQADALPRAATALADAAARLASIEAAWTSAHARASEETSRALRQAVTEVRGDLRDAIERSAAAAEKALAPLVERAVEGSVGVVKGHVLEIAQHLEADAKARHAADEAHAKARHAADEAHAKARHAADEAHAKARHAADAARAKEEAAERTRARALEEARERTLADGAERLTRTATSALDAARERLEAADARDLERRRAIDALLAAIEAHREAAHASSDRQLAAIDALVTAADARARDLTAQGRAQAETLAATLTAQAAAIDARLTATVDAVRDAAALVHAGGAEMTAVAEMFAGAVDRQREAAALWLENLGTIEAAVQNAGESSAASALEEQLNRARELFDVQLQFHRELLGQLRVARGGVTEPPRERREDDASA